MSGLIWIRTVWHSDVIPETISKKNNFENEKSADDKIMKNYQAWKELKANQP